MSKRRETYDRRDVNGSLFCRCERPKVGTEDGERYCLDCGRALPPSDRSRVALAELISDVLDERTVAAQEPLVDAQTIARALGVSRKTVYRRKREFGAIAVGVGPRPRLRFDVEKVRRALDSPRLDTSAHSARPA
jgi:hypothetical protein